MSLKNTIRKQVAATFDRYLQDLAQDVTLTNRTAVSFDFNAGEARIAQGATLTVKGVLLENQRSLDDPTRIENRLLIDANSLEGFSTYDYVRTEDNREFRIESFTNNGFLITAIISGG